MHTNGSIINFTSCCTSLWQYENVLDNQDGKIRRLAENAALSEEVNGTADGGQEYGNAYEYKSESPREGEDEDEEESEHPGEVSIGKKLWTFLTT